MKIVRILGGLGNQMFQYAFYKALEKRHKKVLADLTLFKDYELHNGFELNDVFGIDLREAPQFIINLYDTPNKKWLFRKLRRIINLKNTYKEEIHEFLFDPSFLSDPKPRLYYGYWQNEQYFEDIDIRNDFKFKSPLSEKNQQILNRIENTQSVSIHIRRGDYVNHPLLGNICELPYYQAAISLMDSKLKNPSYFIFSNDITWCKTHLSLEKATYIDWNTAKDSYIDMQLMSACKHQIIANSSFSWWGAWLNQNPNKIVIAPDKWINGEKFNNSEIVPKTWIKILP